MKISSKFLGIGLFGAVLSGCATPALWELTGDLGGGKNTTILSDDVVAMGKPKTALAEYPHALAMVGTKHDYLVTSGESDKAILEKIFGQLDGKALYLLSTSQGKYSVQKGVIYQEFFTGTTNIDFQVSDTIKRTSKAKQSLQTSGVKTSVTVGFGKPAKQVTAQEKATLAQLGFSCTSDRLQTEGRGSAKDSYTDDPTVYTFCHRPTQVDLTVIEKTTNNATLPHKFKRPLAINVSHYRNSSVKNGALMVGAVVLTPVAVAIDIAASPAIIAFCSLAWCSH